MIDRDSIPKEAREGEATHRHYKGGYYKIIGCGKHTENNESLVIYQHVWPHQDTNTLYCRPMEMFTGMVNGKERFEMICPF